MLLNATECDNSFLKLFLIMSRRWPTPCLKILFQNMRNQTIEAPVLTMSDLQNAQNQIVIRLTDSEANYFLIGNSFSVFSPTQSSGQTPIVTNTMMQTKLAGRTDESAKEKAPTHSLSWGETFPHEPPTDDGWFIYVASQCGWLFLKEPPRLIVPGFVRARLN
jgi:hypothetical protein